MFSLNLSTTLPLRQHPVQTWTPHAFLQCPKKIREDLTLSVGILSVRRRGQGRRETNPSFLIVDLFNYSSCMQLARATRKRRTLGILEGTGIQEIVLKVEYFQFILKLPVGNSSVSVRLVLTLFCFSLLVPLPLPPAPARPQLTSQGRT